ncbi:hypothetical protein BJL95_00050 [Methylomonas sp. LWB]|nr:hypothetical protein BJL95_00050 [Methylomonas sp. LWB]
MSRVFNQKFFLKSSIFCGLMTIRTRIAVAEFSKCLLVIAKSARMLAALAVRAGFEVIAVDCFADADTRQIANQTYRVRSLAWDDIKLAVISALGRFRIADVLYGSGFETHPDSLMKLARDWRLLGNQADTFCRLQDKRDFFALLTRLAIPYPQVVFQAPTEAGEWLRKPWRGEGGLGIARSMELERRDASGEGYWQRYVDGIAMSALFVANGESARVVGWNRQWRANLGPDFAFVFAGAVGSVPIPSEVSQVLRTVVIQLTAEYGLRGLNSLDFMLVPDGFRVLELNPRVSASAQLYGDDLLVSHLRGSLGLSLDNVASAPVSKAVRTVFADRNLRVADDFSWPDWVADRPPGGAFFGAGQPICSIIAAGKNSGLAMLQLRRRLHILGTLLETGR